MAKIIYTDDELNIITILDIPENFQANNIDKSPSIDYDSFSTDTGVNFWDLIN